jgi:hypothetical protein
MIAAVTLGGLARAIPPSLLFGSSPLVASCRFAVGRRVVADIVLPGAHAQIPSAVYKEKEVVAQGGVRPDALRAAELSAGGHIRVAGRHCGELDA